MFRRSALASSSSLAACQFLVLFLYIVYAGRLYISICLVDLPWPPLRVAFACPLLGTRPIQESPSGGTRDGGIEHIGFQLFLLNSMVGGQSDGGSWGGSKKFWIHKFLDPKMFGFKFVQDPKIWIRKVLDPKNLGSKSVWIRK